MSIKIFNENGNVTEYKKLSERLPDFLKAYPPREGFRVEITVNELLSQRPAMMSLIKMAIKAGKSPIEVGLSIGKTSFVFEATLFSKDGDVIANDRSLQPITELKDYERGMTAARQRLVAALGFGGEVFDDNEIEIIQQLNGEVKDNDLTHPSQIQANENPTPTPPKKTRRGRKKKAVDADVVTETEVENTTNTSASEVSQDLSVDDVPDAILRQIAHQANMKGVETPVVNNLEEAKKALQLLLS